MPVLNFKKQFVEPIRSEVKHHTIRAKRKHPIKPGDKLYLYCGLRQRGAFRILQEPQLCTKVEPIEIRINHGVPYVLVDDGILAADEANRLAQADGFDNYAMFLHFWQKTHGDKNGEVEFKGDIIHWR